MSTQRSRAPYISIVHHINANQNSVSAGPARSITAAQMDGPCDTVISDYLPIIRARSAAGRARVARTFDRYDGRR
ncbi:hypothetical protein EVAR_20844_1 [Eumeta japonica]|uniref:Uncharacterized protein n=1 Tax=Eumeta variegata TaxID=151549 RepID=A0A4C1UEG5_EUMVA|nr:hypothetical protein EVAR_20844_1 [Eumeta japonica]